MNRPLGSQITESRGELLHFGRIPQGSGAGKRFGSGVFGPAVNFFHVPSHEHSSLIPQVSALSK